jgi:hypothetical protein
MYSREEALVLAKSLFDEKFKNQYIGRDDTLNFTITRDNPKYNQSFTFTMSEVFGDGIFPLESYYIKFNFDIPKNTDTKTENDKERIWAAVKAVSGGS